jgi:hypothetical protein
MNGTAQVELDEERYAIQHENDPVDAPRRFHFRLASSLCDTPSAAEWLIKPILDKRSLSMIFGDAGTMKSFLATDLGLSIATGKDWHDHETRQSGPVFFIAGEGFGGMPRRIKAWETYHKTDLHGVPFYVSDRPGRFLDKNGVGEIVKAVDELVKENGKPVLVIIDTLNRNFGGGDENSTADMTRFISAVDVLRTRYQCAILIIHHSGLSATERARGASALRAALDWEYRLQKNANGIRILTCTKSKDHTEPPSLSFMPQTITIDEWIDPEDGEPMTSCVLVSTEGTTADKKPLTGARKVAFDTLLAVGEKYVHIDTWRDAAYSSGISPSSSHEAKKKAFQRAVSGLRSSGYVDTRDDYWWPVRDTGQQGDNSGTMSPGH